MKNISNSILYGIDTIIMLYGARDYSGYINLYTFIGVKAGYISHCVDIVRFNSKKFMNSGHSRI